MKKRSQATIFIILGLILLAGVMLFFFLRQSNVEDTTMMEPHVDEVPHSYRVVQEYVISCVREIGKDAIKRAGEHGGYINISNNDYTTKSFETGTSPTNSDVVHLSRQSHPIPYYWHMKSDNKCRDCQVSTQKIPSLSSIEEQVGTYVDKHLDKCLGDMQELKVMGYSIDKKTPETKVNVLKNRVVVQTEYPMKVTLNGSTSKQIDQFGVDLEVPLLRSYKLALYLTSKEAKDQYLETAAMTLVSYYSGLDPQKLPPIVHVDEGYNTVKWVKTAAKQKFRNLLNTYIPVFRVEKTKNGQEINMGDTYQNAYFGHTLLENNISMKDSNVNFFFLDWPIHFDITPSEGELLKPSTFKSEYPFNMIPPTQTNHYEFFYDFSFPVVVDISSSKAFKGEGFDFMFAMEGNVRDNKNLLNWYHGEGTIGPWDFSNVNYNVNSNALPDMNQSKKEELSPQKSLICDENQRIVGPVKIEVKDSYITKPVEEASVTFKCGNYKSCNLGETNFNGILKTKIPLCQGGGLVVEKEGYRPHIIGNVTTNLSREVNYEIKLERLMEKTIQVRKIPYSALNATHGIAYETRKKIIDNETLELLPREKVILNFVKKKDSFYETQFTRAVQVHGNQTATVELVPGRYKIRASLIDEEGVITKRVNKNYSQKTVTYPSVNMTPAMLGGARINANTGLWKVTEEKLEKPMIEFYVIGYPPPEIITDMKYMGNMEKHSNMSRLFIEPRFMKME